MVIITGLTKCADFKSWNVLSLYYLSCCTYLFLAQATVLIYFLFYSL